VSFVHARPPVRRSFPTRRSSDLATVVVPLEEEHLPAAPTSSAPAAASVSPLVPMTGRNAASSAPKTLLNRPTVRAARQRTTPSKDRKSTRLNSSHEWISYAVFCL